MSGLEGVEVGSVLCEGWAESPLHSEVGTMIIRAVAASQQPVQKISFANGGYECVNADFLDFAAADIEAGKHVAGHLKELYIELPELTAESAPSFYEKFVCYEFLTWSTNLRWLYLTSNLGDAIPSLCDIIWTVHLPCLEGVRLERIAGEAEELIYSGAIDQH